MLDGLCEWIGRKGYTSVDDIRGLLAVPHRVRRGRARTRGLRQRACGVPNSGRLRAVLTHQPATASTSSKPATRQS